MSMEIQNGDPSASPQDDNRMTGSIVTLRMPTENDAPALMRILSDKKTIEHLGPSTPEGGWTLDAAKEYFRSRLELQKNGRGLVRCVELNSNKQMIGVAGCRSLDLEKHAANMGFTIDRAYWGNGAATECLLLLCDYLIGEYAIERIEFQTLEGNMRARKFCENAGIKFEGVTIVDIGDGKKENIATFILEKKSYGHVRQLLIRRREFQKNS